MIPPEPSHVDPPATAAQETKPDSRWSGFDIEKAPDMGGNARIERRQAKRHAAQEWVRELLSIKAAWLLEGQAAPSDAAETVRQLLKEVDGEGDNETRRLRRNFLIRGIDAGVRERRWNISVPPQTMRLRLPTPAINETNFRQIGNIDALRRSFLESLKDPAFPQLPRVLSFRRFARANLPLASRDLVAGQALLAAILFGGVASKETLLAIAGAAQLHAYGGCVWIEWPLYSEVDGVIYRWRRWQPEQVSGFLIARAHRDTGFPLIHSRENISLASDVWRRIDAILAILPPFRDKPESLASLLKWAKTWNYFNIPPFLAAYACGKLESPNMEPDAYQRIVTGRAASGNGPAPTPQPAQGHPPRKAISHDALQHDPPARVAELSKSLRALLKGSHIKSRARKVLNGFLQRTDVSPVFVRLAEWVYELCHRRVGEDQKGLSTLHDYLALIDRPLAIAFEGRDPGTLDGSELGMLYDEILQSVQKRRAARMVRPLKMFHNYLVAAHGVEIDVGPVFEGYGSEAMVDANMVTEREYLKAFGLLAPEVSAYPAWEAKRHQAALLLGYRFKLRRGECLRLRLGDICGAVYGALYVRSTELGKVKTRSSVRNLPFSGCLNEIETTFLKQFITERLQDISGSPDTRRLLSPFDPENEKLRGRPIFEHPSRPGKAMSEVLLFDPVVSTLQQVTMDESIHYHLNRKGGLNDRLLRTMEEEIPGCSALLHPETPDTDKDKKPDRKLVGKETGDRRKLWAVAGEAGHGDLGTLTGSYLLLFDWLLACALKDRSPEIGSSQLSALTGLTANNIRVQRKNKKVAPDDWLHWVAHKHEKWLANITPASASQSTPAQSAPASAPLRVTAKLPMTGLDMLAFIKEALRPGEDIEKLSRRYSVHPEDARSWLDQAEALSRLKGKSHAPRGATPKKSVELPAVSSAGIRISRKVHPVTPLNQRDERRRMNSWTVALYRYANEQPSAIAEWLNVFWENREPRLHEIRFANAGAAAQFIKQLEQIAPKGTGGIGYSLYPLTHAKAATAEKQRDAWATALGVAGDSIKIASGIRHQYGGDGNGSLAIYLAHKHTLSRETEKKRAKGVVPKNAWEKNKSTALESACYVVTIWMLAAGKDGADGTNSSAP